MSEDNTFPHFVESLLGIDRGEVVDEGPAQGTEDNDSFDPLAELASVNQCLSKESLMQLNKKLVRFDCQICDMYEEEYFVPVVPTKASQESGGKPLVYKYFAELSQEQISDY